MLNFHESIPFHPPRITHLTLLYLAKIKKKQKNSYFSHLKLQSFLTLIRASSHKWNQNCYCGSSSFFIFKLFNIQPMEPSSIRQNMEIPRFQSSCNKTTLMVHHQFHAVSYFLFSFLKQQLIKFNMFSTIAQHILSAAMHPCCIVSDTSILQLLLL